MERQLDLTIRLNEDGFEVDVYEPEARDFDTSSSTQEVSQLQFSYSFDEHPKFDSAIGNEIYSWISRWKDAVEG